MTDSSAGEPGSGLTPEQQLRNRLRFSVFLQSAACVLFAIACIIRGLTFGIDVLTVIFGVIAVAAGAAAWYTRSRAKALGT